MTVILVISVDVPLPVAAVISVDVMLTVAVVITVRRSFIRVLLAVTTAIILRRFCGDMTMTVTVFIKVRPRRYSLGGGGRHCNDQQHRKCQLAPIAHSYFNLQLMHQK